MQRELMLAESKGQFSSSCQDIRYRGSGPIPPTAWTPMADRGLHAGGTGSDTFCGTRTRKLRSSFVRCRHIPSQLVCWAVEPTAPCLVALVDGSSWESKSLPESWHCPPDMCCGSSRQASKRNFSSTVQTSRNLNPKDALSLPRWWGIDQMSIRVARNDLMALTSTSADVRLKRCTRKCRVQLRETYPWCPRG